jgi:aspartate beta-hydroxylase
LHRGDVLESMGRHDEAVMAYWQAWRGFPNPEALAVEELVPPTLRGLLQRAGQSLRDAQARLMQESLGPVRERHGAEALQRINETVDIYLGLKRNPYQHALQRPALLYLPGLAPRSFFEREEFTWTKALEAATPKIVKEFDAAIASETGLAPYVQADPGVDPQQWRELNGSRAWSALHLTKGGIRDAPNCARCPETMQALSAVPLADIPGHAPEVFFSILEPGTHIPAHFGLGNYKLATHLPLRIPPDCAIRVGNETRGWTEGECLIFDDSFQHEAWNRSQERRAVLIFDVWHPEVTLAEREGITALIQATEAFNRKYRPAT